jgi:hypothetical protein
LKDPPLTRWLPLLVLLADEGGLVPQHAEARVYGEPVEGNIAENFTIINGREIQSAYWVAKQVTMFIGVSQHLCHTAWATVSGKLARGQEVSVQSTPAGYRFALVDAHADGAITEDSDISLVDEHGTTFSAKRRDIRTRKIITIAHNGVSNDMKHDTWMVQVRGFPLFSELRAAHRYLLYCSTASH